MQTLKEPQVVFILDPYLYHCLFYRNIPAYGAAGHVGVLGKEEGEIAPFHTYEGP